MVVFRAAIWAASMGSNRSATRRRNSLIERRAVLARSKDSGSVTFTIWSDWAWTASSAVGSVMAPPCALCVIWPASLDNLGNTRHADQHRPMRKPPGVSIVGIQNTTFPFQVDHRDGVPRLVNEATGDNLDLHK